jgi:hypothetical protein
MPWAPAYYLDNLAQLKEYVSIADADTLDDNAVELAAIAASRAIDRMTRRQFGQTDEAEARYCTAKYDHVDGLWFVDVDDFMSTDDLAIDYDTAGDETYATAATTWLKRPLNAAVKSRPWTTIVLRDTPPTGVGAVLVTAVWGWASVPATFKQATMLQAARFLKRRDAVFGVAGDPSLGSEIRLQDKVDADVAVMLREYRKVVLGG